MAVYRTNRDIVYPETREYPSFVLPKGTVVTLVKGADGLKGDLWTVRDSSVIMDLTGNKHDPIYRYTWVSADFVEPETV
jgi:hypothetical protein